MPYNNHEATENQTALYYAFHASIFYPITAVVEFVNKSYTFDFSSVEGRRQTLAALQTFLGEGKTGTQLFGYASRFVGSGAFICNHDGEVARVVGQISSALTMIRDTTAKDTAAPRGNKSDDQFQISDQGTQDAKKSFDEARTSLLKFSGMSPMLWTRASFERRSGLVWS